MHFKVGGHVRLCLRAKTSRAGNHGKEAQGPGIHLQGQETRTLQRSLLQPGRTEEKFQEADRPFLVRLRRLHGGEQVRTPGLPRGRRLRQEGAVGSLRMEQHFAPFGRHVRLPRRRQESRRSFLDFRDQRVHFERYFRRFRPAARRARRRRLPREVDHLWGRGSTRTLGDQHRKLLHRQCLQPPELRPSAVTAFLLSPRPVKIRFCFSTGATLLS